MGHPRFTEDFKIDAVKQVTERGYCVSDVSQRLGVSTHSLYAWMKRYSPSPGNTSKDDQSVEIRRLKQELARVTEERDILKKATVDSTCQRNSYSDNIHDGELSDETSVHKRRARSCL